MPADALADQWAHTEADLNKARTDKESLVIESIPDRGLLLARAFAVAQRAVEIAFANPKASSSSGSELMNWILARAVDARRELLAGNLAGGTVMFRSVVEGHTILLATLAEADLAKKFAEFGFVSQAEARATVDPTHPKYSGQAPPDDYPLDEPNLLGSFYSTLSNMAHPTRFACLLQSEPPIGEPKDAKSERTFVLGSVYWPDSTNRYLASLTLRLCSLVDAALTFPISQEQAEWLRTQKTGIEESFVQVWPIKA